MSWPNMPENAMATSTNGVFDPKAFLASVGEGRRLTNSGEGQVIFTQGDPADALFYVQKGKVKVTTISSQGKEAVVAILGPGDFFGEGCLAGQPLRISTVATLTVSSIARLDKAAVIRVLHDEPAFSELFMSYLLARNIRMEADLIDQLFNSSEKRLARLLLLLANFGQEGRPQPVIAKISQKTLAEMIGTTRSRVSHFMNKFRRLGFITYNGHLEIHSSLLSVVLHDDPRSVRDPEVSDLEQGGD
ncbi:MAG TPA: Crp/Fnr family transcriptional regulator [Steroidobacteraceae bacterium]|jgi:CRP-like cAMP-binding protein|nr:Crp/Fnr family transcriptional regulator [Steroidobacteraceae bacterium]